MQKQNKKMEKTNYKLPRTVSAVITTCMRTPCVVRRAVDSVLGQSVPVDEILIVDYNSDGSSASDAIRDMESLSPLIQYVPFPTEDGLADARNYGWMKAKGDWIAFLDDTDEWIPGKIRIQLELAGKHPDAGMVFGLGQIVNDYTGMMSDFPQEKFFKTDPTYADILKRDYIGPASNPLILREAFIAVGGFLTGMQPAQENYEMWIRVASEYPVYGIDSVLFLQHTDGQQRSYEDALNDFIGYKNIYLQNQGEYDVRKKAKTAIMYNIMREGIKAKNPAVVPYCFEWAKNAILARSIGK